MKKNASHLLGIAALAVVMSSLVGCAESEFKTIKEPIVIGNKAYTAVVAKDRDTWGVNVSTVMIAETECVQEPQQCAHAPQPAPMTWRHCPPRERYVLEPQQPSEAYQPGPPVQQREGHYYVWVPYQAVACQQAPPEQQPKQRFKTTAVNFNNVGGNGVWTSFFEEGFAGLAQGAGTAVTGFGFRPSRSIVNALAEGGNASARGGNATGGNGGNAFSSSHAVGTGTATVH